MEKTRLIDEIKRIIQKTRLENSSLFCVSNKKLYLVLDVETFYNLKAEYLKDLQDKRINCQIQSEDLDIFGVTVCPGKIANKRKKSHKDDDDFVYQFCKNNPRDFEKNQNLNLFSITGCNSPVKHLEYSVFSEALNDILEQKIHIHNVPYFKRNHNVFSFFKKLFLLNDLTITTESFTRVKQFILYPFINTNNNQERIEILHYPEPISQQEGTEPIFKDKHCSFSTLILNRKKFRCNPPMDTGVEKATDTPFYKTKEHALQMEKEIINRENNITRKENCDVEIPKSKKGLFLFRLKKIFPFLCNYRIFNHKKRIYNFEIEININISNKNINKLINNYTIDRLISEQRFYYSEHHETHTLSKAS